MIYKEQQQQPLFFSWSNTQIRFMSIKYVYFNGNTAMWSKFYRVFFVLAWRASNIASCLQNYSYQFPFRTRFTCTTRGQRTMKKSLQREGKWIWHRGRRGRIIEEHSSHVMNAHLLLAHKCALKHTRSFRLECFVYCVYVYSNAGQNDCIEHVTMFHAPLTWEDQHKKNQKHSWIGSWTLKTNTPKFDLNSRARFDFIDAIHTHYAFNFNASSKYDHWTMFSHCHR